MPPTTPGPSGPLRGSRLLEARRQLAVGAALSVGLATVAVTLAAAQTPPAATSAATSAPATARAATAVPVGQAVQPPAAYPLADLLPDSELVYGFTLAGFDTEAFVAGQGGYLARYHETVGSEVLSGAQIVERVALAYSISPKVLLALMQASSGWVTVAEPTERSFPVGEPLPGLYAGLTAVAGELNRLYYGHRLDGLRVFPVADGRQVRLEDTNAATFAVIGLVSRRVLLADWAGLEAPSRFQLAYMGLFGDPYFRIPDTAVAPAPPVSLRMPFPEGELWYFVVGPHSPIGVGGPRAAIDFAPPPAAASGCQPSPAWVTAAAEGRVLRADGDAMAVEVPAIGYALDDFEGTGWVHIYDHLSPVERTPPGTVVQVGDRLGHPGCAGAALPLTRVAFSRKFNGEWVPTDDPLTPLTLGGWAALAGPEPGSGWLATAGQPPRVAGLTKQDATNGVIAQPQTP